MSLGSSWSRTHSFSFLVLYSSHNALSPHYILNELISPYQCQLFFLVQARLPLEEGMSEGDIGNLAPVGDTISLAENRKDLEQMLMKVQEESAKARLHQDIKKT